MATLTYDWLICLKIIWRQCLVRHGESLACPMHATLQVFHDFSDNFGPFLAEKFYEQTIFLISFNTGSFNAPWPQPVGMEVSGRLLVRRI